MRATFRAQRLLVVSARRGFRALLFRRRHTWIDASGMIANTFSTSNILGYACCRFVNDFELTQVVSCVSVALFLYLVTSIGFSFAMVLTVS